jgi:hypothetical protein
MALLCYVFFAWLVLDPCVYCIYTRGCKGVKNIMTKKYTYKEYLKDDNNKQIRDIAKSLDSIASSLKFFEVIILNDSNYTTKNKKDIDVNVSKINEVVKYVKYKI